MSSIKTTQIDGDIAVGRNVATGGKLDVAGSATIGHNLKVDGWLEAANIKGANKGIFLTVQELREAYPNPHDGWMAGVGSSTPFTAYIGKGGDWVATGGTIEVTVDMSQYTEGVAQLQEDIDNVKAEVNTNKTNINSHTQQLTTLGNQLNSVTETADATKAQSDTNKGNIATIDASMKKIAEDVTTIEQNVSAIEQNVSAIEQSKGIPNGIATLDDAGLVSDMDLHDTVFDVLPFDLIVEDKNADGTLQGDSYSVAYDTKAKRFYAYEQSDTDAETGQYYLNWLTGTRYNNGTEPYTDKIYLNTAEAAAYCYANGVLTPLDTHITLGTTADTAFPGDKGASLQEDIGNLNGWREEAEEQMADTAEQCDAAGVVNATSLLGYGYQKPQAMTFADVLAKVWANDKTVKHPGVVLTYYTDKGWKSKQWTNSGEREESDWTDESNWEDFSGDEKEVLTFDGTVDNANVQDVAVNTPTGVVFNNATKSFCAYVRQGTSLVRLYFSDWPTRSNYQDEDNDVPHTSKIFVDTTDNVPYIWNGNDIVQIAPKSIPAAVFNPTVEFPVDGYYELWNDTDTSLSAIHAAYDNGKASLGLLMTFKVSKTKWKTYQYTGTSTKEAIFKNVENWQDFGSMAEGSLNYIVINNLCGAPTAGSYYTLESAVTRLVAYEQETGVSYIKTGLVISYMSAENTMETKQFQGSSAADASQVGLWKDFGGGGMVETSDTPEEGGTDALSTGGAWTSIPTDLVVNTETEGVVKMSMVNAAGEVVGNEAQFPVGTGSGGGAGTVVTITPEQSPMYAKAGATVTLKCAVRSVTTQGKTEQTNIIERVELYDRDTNQLLETFKLNQASSADAETYDFAFDLSSYFTQASTRKFKMVVYDDSENTGSRNINVTAVDVTISSEQTLNYTSSTVVNVGGATRTLPMYKFANNASDKGILCITEIYLDGQWQVLGTATINDTYTHSVSINPNNCLGKVLEHGAYALRIHGTDVASGVVGNYLYTTIMVTEQDNTTPIVAVRYYSDGETPTVQQYETVSIDFAVYDPAKSTATASVYVDGEKELSRDCYRATTYTFTKQIQNVATDGSYAMKVQVKCGTSESSVASWNVNGSILDIEPVTTQLMLDMDFAARSNADADHSITYGKYSLTLEGANWSTNGFVKDTFGTSEYGSESDTGVMSLRIAENVKGTLNYKPFSNTAIETNGIAVQWRMKVKNVADDNAKVMQCIVNGFGFYVTGTQVVVTSDNNETVAKSIASAFNDDTLVDVAIVIEPRSQAPYGGIGVMKMYFDGELIGACYYEPGTLVKHDTNITFDGTNADLYLYNIRAWETFYSFEQSFNNYLLKLADTNSMITEYTFNQVMVSQSAEGKPATNRPQASALYDKGIPYFVVCKNADTDNTSDQYPDYLETLDGDKKTKRILDVYAYFPDRPWQDFKAIGATVTNQGTTSSQRPIKNIKMKLKAATITLLHTADEFTGEELEKYNKCAKNAAKHKVAIYEDSLATNIITVKVDYSESGGANNGASTQLYNELQWALGNDYITPAQRFNSGSYKINTSINSIPCSFCRTDEHSADATSPSYGYFHAKGNWNEDKGDAKVFGFEAVDGYNGECLNYGDFYELVAAKGQTLADYLSNADKTTWNFEESTNSDGTVNYWETIVLSEFCGPNHRIFRKKDGTWQETTGTMTFENGAWKVTGDYVNPVENYELLKYDALDWMQGVNTVDDMLAPDTDGNPIWLQYYESRYPDDDNLNALYESGKKVPYNLYKWLHFCQECNHHLTETDGSITIDGETVDGTTANRLMKWRKELHTVANVYSLLCYHVFTDYIAAVDQRSKNMMVGFYLDTDGVTRMYLNHLYDGDTILGSDNDCGLTVPALLDPNTDTAYYQGWDSVLFQQIKNAELEPFTLPDGSTVTTRQVAQKMRTQTIGSGLIPLSPAGLTKYWITDRLSKWPKLVSSFDGMRKYVEHSKATANYFFALHGLSIQRLKAFIEERFLFRDGFYQTGDLYSSTFNMRISAALDVTIKIKAAKQGFFGLAVERVDTITDSCYLAEGEEYTLKANSHILGSGNMMYVLGANKIAEIDISCGTVSESGWSISEMVLLRKLVIGGENHTPVTITAGALKNLNLGSMPFLEEIDIRNTGVTTVNATYCPRLASIKAAGSNLTTLTLAETSPVSELSLPGTMTSLAFVNLPNLVYPDGGLTIDSVANVKSISLSGCPGIDTQSFLESIMDAKAKVKTISMNGLDFTASSEMLTYFKEQGVRGMDDEGDVCTGLQGRWILTDLLTEDALTELQEYYPDLSILNMQFSAICFDDMVADPENITNLDNNTGYGTGNVFKASNHPLAIRAMMHAYKGKLNADTNVWEGVQISDENYRYLADGTAFDYKDSTGEGWDIMMLMPHCWYKGVNDFKNQKKYIFWSSNKEEPLSTATSILRKTLSDIVYVKRSVINVDNIVIGESVMATDASFISTSTNYNVCCINVKGMKQVRWPGVNSASVGAVFANGQGVCLKTFKMAISNVAFDFMDGDYIYCDVPDDAELFYFTSKADDSNLEAIVVDSANPEAIEPDWVESDACLGGVYAASLDSLMQLRSISGTQVRKGGYGATSLDWTYDSEGNPTNTPTITGFSAVDLLNLTLRRGEGYQAFDYEMSKFAAILFYSLTGNRDAQLVCGYGSSYYKTNGDADTLGNSDSTNGQITGNKCLGFENFFGCACEIMSNIAVNVNTYAQWKKEKYSYTNSAYPQDNKIHIYDPLTKTERVVQGVQGDVLNIGRVRHGRYCDVLASYVTTDNSVFSTYYCDALIAYGRIGTGVMRGGQNGVRSGLAYEYIQQMAEAGAQTTIRLAYRGKMKLEE